MLSENELNEVFTLAKRADVIQLVALTSLFQSMTEVVVREEQEKLALLISREEKA